MCDYLNEHGHCCGACNTAGTNEYMNGHTFRCDCGERAVKTYDCEICGKEQCPACAVDSKDGMDMDWEKTGWRVCGECRENGAAWKALAKDLDKENEQLRAKAQFYDLTLHRIDEMTEPGTVLKGYVEETIHSIHTVPGADLSIAS